MYTETEVLEYVQEEDVKFIRLAFFDLYGKQKNVSIMPSELPTAFKHGISFDASSVRGFQTVDKSDLFLHPDPDTLAVLPWRPSQGKVVRMFCEIRYPDGTPYEKDFRYHLTKAMETAKNDYGVEFNIGTETEFYLFKLDENGNPTKVPYDNAGYMDIAPEDKGENIRREICFTLEQMGFTPEASHHEAGPGQNEIDFKYSNPLVAADNCETFKWIVRTKAASNGLYADFSPKPLLDQAGSGMHINISVKHLDKSDNSEITTQMLAGILKHMAEMTFFLDSVEDSYKRLGSCKAPRYISWGNGNRSQCVRIPSSKKETRLELRSPDPETNPYLAFTLVIYAALDGIKNKLEPSSSVDANLFENEENDVANLKKLPETIEKAYEIAKNSEFIQSILGKEVVENFKK